MVIWKHSPCQWSFMLCSNGWGYIKVSSSKCDHTEQEPKRTWLGFVSMLTHRGRVTHIGVGNLAIIGSDNGLSPGRRQAIISTNAGVFFYLTLRDKLQWNINGNWCIFIREMYSKMSSVKYRPSYLGLNVLRQCIRLVFLLPWLLTISLWFHRIYKYPQSAVDICVTYFKEHIFPIDCAKKNHVRPNVLMSCLWYYVSSRLIMNTQEFFSVHYTQL